MKTFKDIEKQAKSELTEELIEAKKELLKERIREIRSSKRVLNKLEEKYQELLDTEIEDV